MKNEFKLTKINADLFHSKIRTDGVKCVHFGALTPDKNFSLFTSHLSRKYAFTLSEVLITLGIIGVVAAMTMPSLMNKIQNRHLVTALKKAYSVLSQANAMVQIEHPSSEWTLIDGNFENSKVLFDLYKPYLKIAKDCGCGTTVTGCWSEDATKTISGVVASAASKGRMGNNHCAVRLVDGMNLSFDEWSYTGSGIWVESLMKKTNPFFYVDVNGDKKPNTLGKDVFLFFIDPDKGALVPSGTYNKSESCNSGSKSNFADHDCAAKVLLEGKISY